MKQTTSAEGRLPCNVTGSNARAPQCSGQPTRPSGAAEAPGALQYAAACRPLRTCISHIAIQRPRAAVYLSGHRRCKALRALSGRPLPPGRRLPGSRDRGRIGRRTVFRSAVFGRHAAGGGAGGPADVLAERRPPPGGCQTERSRPAAADGGDWSLATVPVALHWP